MTWTLIRMAWRTLLARRINLLIGFFILLASTILVVGTSLVSSVDRAMKDSFVETMTGHLLVYASESDKDGPDSLELFSLSGPPELQPVSDFGTVRRALEALPGVKGVLPMGLSDSRVVGGNVADRVLARLRALSREVAQTGGSEAQRDDAVAHVRRLLEFLRADLDRGRGVVDDAALAEAKAQVDHALSPEFWSGFEADPHSGLELLENRIAPQFDEAQPISLFHLGTDLDAFRRTFQRLRLVSGEWVPEGERGLLVNQLVYEDAFKLPVARRLDRISKALAEGRTLAEDLELTRWVEQNRAQAQEVLLTMSPGAVTKVQGALVGVLGASAQTSLAELLDQLLATDDQNFARHYRAFYDHVAPSVELYRVEVGDSLALKAEARSGYTRAVEVKLWGTVEFQGLEEAEVVAISLLDKASYNELYGHLTPELADEISALRSEAGVQTLSPSELEARVFGGGEPAPAAASAAPPSKALSADQAGVLFAAVMLDDAGRADEVAAAIRSLRAEKKWALGVVGWKKAVGFFGRFTDLARGIVLFAAFVIFIALTLTMNNTMMIATLRRTAEMGALRAMGAFRETVLLLVLFEALMVALVFGALGAGAGSALVLKLGGSGIPAANGFLSFLFGGAALHPQLGWTQVAVPFAVVVTVVVASALFPALVAARVAPVTAMQTEE